MAAYTLEDSGLLPKAVPWEPALFAGKGIAGLSLGAMSSSISDHYVKKELFPL